MNSDGLDNLIEGIIVQYCKDYVRLLRGIKVDESVTIESCENFFHSPWFETATTINPDYLISELKKKAINTKRDGRKKKETKE